ncbi:MAG: ClbS/DfsB family four-helix bundle protein [Caldilineae bacterium]|nr:MAG: ClbS/DfsB family four-helix bundle protein [Caldilineae bacterium]
MDTVAEAISDLQYALEQVQEQFAGLDEAELNSAVVDEAHGYTARDVLAHLAGWADYVLDVLPQMLATVDSSLPPVDAEARNAQARAARQEQSAAAILREFEQKHRQIVQLLRSASPEELTLRRTLRGKIYTIKSYVVDVMTHYILETAELLKTWRARRVEKPWIRWVYDHEATGLLKKEYEKAIRRAGRVYNIVRVMSLRPATLKASMQLYGSVVQRQSPRLSRAHREMIAVVVSQANHCHY